MSELSRRELLGHAGKLAVVAAAVSPGGLIAACTPRRRPDDALADLAARIQGSVVLPSNPAYGDERLVFNTRYDEIYPRAIVLCQSIDDVAQTMRWRAENRVPLVARSGRHSYAGYSTSPGIVLDVSHIHEISFDSSTGEATVGAGNKLIDVYSQLWEHKVTIPGGDCPTVGISGLALGGGIGFVGRKFGTTSDNLTEVEIVTADGVAINCDESHNSDLFWACRGGGGGNFGIVTKLKFKTHPVGDVSYFSIEWPWEAAGRVVAAWQSWIAALPDEISPQLELLAGIKDAATGQTRLSVNCTGQFFGSESTLRQILAPLLEGSVGSPSKLTIKTDNFMNATLYWAGCESVAECQPAGRSPAGKVERVTQMAKSDYFTRPLSQSGIDAVVHWIEDRQANPQTPGRGGAQFYAYGGAHNRVPSDATAFVHRDAVFSIQYLAYWDARDANAIASANENWIREFYAAMRSHASGYAYQNNIDPQLSNWEHAYYGSNLDRLIDVKAKYDPANVFEFAQSIPVRR